MIVAGVDIGSTACKAVILRDESIAGCAIGPSSALPQQTAEAIYARALLEAGVARDEVACVIGTGYGRALVPFADDNVSELTCHGRGASYVDPAVRTVLDIGGQDTKAIRIDEHGFLVEYAMNDKCAAGTGRFLEAMARSLGLALDELDARSLAAPRARVITSMCSVFAESEVINLVNDGAPADEIARGLHDAMAGRVVALARRVAVVEAVMVTGGVGKSAGLIRSLAEKLGLAPVPAGVDPQIIGALGAAVEAYERAG